MTGEDAAVPSEEPAQEKAEEPAGTTYGVNTNTRKFHETTCRHGKTIKEKNRLDVTGSRDDLIAQGYAPCTVCNP